jgi:hypothetical protein
MLAMMVKRSASAPVVVLEHKPYEATVLDHGYPHLIYARVP